LNSDGQKRSAVYHAARLEMLRNRVIQRMDRTDDAADKAQAAAELFAEAVQPVVSRVMLGA
jgi:hypothetical protein